MISQEGLVLIVVGLAVVVVLAATMFNLKILSLCFKLYTEYFKDRAMSKRTEAGAPAGDPMDVTEKEQAKKE